MRAVCRRHRRAHQKILIKDAEIADGRDAVVQGGRIRPVLREQKHRRGAGKILLEQIAVGRFVFEDAHHFAQAVEIGGDFVFEHAIVLVEVLFGHRHGADDAHREAAHAQRLRQADQHIDVASGQVNHRRARFIDVADELFRSGKRHVVLLVIVGEETFGPFGFDELDFVFVRDAQARKRILRTILVILQIVDFAAFDCLYQLRHLVVKLVGYLAKDVHGSGTVVIQRSIQVEDDHRGCLAFRLDVNSVENALQMEVLAVLVFLGPIGQYGLVGVHVRFPFKIVFQKGVSQPTLGAIVRKVAPIVNMDIDGHRYLVTTQPLLLSRGAALDPAKGLRPLEPTIFFVFLLIVFMNQCEMGPLPHSEQNLSVFIRFTFWNAYSIMKVKGRAE